VARAISYRTLSGLADEPDIAAKVGQEQPISLKKLKIYEFKWQDFI